MGNKPCCCRDDQPNVEVKVKDVYCCQDIKSSCCIRTERRHHHHKTTHSKVELKLDNL
jgi:hypothetical protein